MIFTCWGSLVWVITFLIPRLNSGCVTNGFLKGEFTGPWFLSFPFGEDHMVEYLGRATFDWKAMGNGKSGVREVSLSPHRLVRKASCSPVKTTSTKNHGHRVPLKSIPLRILPHFKAKSNASLVLTEELTFNVTIYSKFRLLPTLHWRPEIVL